MLLLISLEMFMCIQLHKCDYVMFVILVFFLLDLGNVL